jgi:hypothetical protein
LPKHRVMRAEIILEWFRRHLMADPPPAHDEPAAG